MRRTTRYTTPSERDVGKDTGPATTEDRVALMILVGHALDVRSVDKQRDETATRFIILWAREPTEEQKALAVELLHGATCLHTV